MEKIRILKITVFSLLLLLFGFCNEDDPIVQYSLTTQCTPTESGTVSPSTGIFNEGDEISLTAIPSPEYIFKNWSEGATGTENPLTIIMSADKNITAVFEKINYSLTIIVEGEGTVTEEIIEAKASGDYPSGSIIKLTAVPSEEWEFDEWVGDYVGEENPMQITVDEPKSLTAKFKKKNYTVTIIVEGEGTVTDELIEGKSPLDYPSGSIIKLTAIPSEGWEFDEWSGDYVGEENPIQITVDEPKSLTAKFIDVRLKTYVPDDNFEQALIDLGYDDILDNYVNTSKIDKIIELSIISKNISDLTGIGDFISLETLWCPSNQLTNLDLSANHSLIDLYCDNNQIVSLDLSSNTALTTLYCGDNLLNSINLVNNLFLTSLHCERNNFTELDVSNHPILVGLNCEENMLTELNVFNNTKLIYLNFKNNQLTTLDISNNTNLYTLDCSNNQLTSLDISNNVLIGTSMFFSFLNCTNNQIDCIQVSQYQLDNIPTSWLKDDSAIYSVDCN